MGGAHLMSARAWLTAVALLAVTTGCGLKRPPRPPEGPPSEAR